MFIVITDCNSFRFSVADQSYFYLAQLGHRMIQAPAVIEKFRININV
jgi:hypothetical protein